VSEDFIDADALEGRCACGAQLPVRGAVRCWDCDDRLAAEFAEQQRREEGERRRREWEVHLADVRANLPHHMAAAGVPTGYLRFTRASWEARYGRWEDRESTRGLVGWPQPPLDPAAWLVVFYGPYGRRKTSMATALLAEGLLRGLRCRWWDMNDYLERLRRGIRLERDGHYGHGSYGEVKLEAVDCDLLVLDDLGAVRGARAAPPSPSVVMHDRSQAGWWQEEVAYLLRQRHSWVRATVVTHNGARVEDVGIVDQSLVSRMDVGFAFDMDDGVDHRREAAAADAREV
jgi:hypothetical protein